MPVAERKKKAAKKIAPLAKEGHIINPIVIEGYAVAKLFGEKPDIST